MGNDIGRRKYPLDRNGTVKMPFAGYEDFESCVRQNQDAADPNAYCAAIQRQVEYEDNKDHQIPV